MRRIWGSCETSWTALPETVCRSPMLFMIRTTLVATANNRTCICSFLHDKTMTMRETPEQHFKRYNREHPERGGAQKDDAFRHRGAIKAHRVLITDILNVHLEYAGQAARVHPDSWNSDSLTENQSRSCCPARAGRTANRDNQCPHAGGARHPAGAGVPRGEGTRTSPHVLGKTEGRTRDHGCAAHGTHTLCDHGGTGTDPRSCSCTASGGP